MIEQESKHSEQAFESDAETYKRTNAERFSHNLKKLLSINDKYQQDLVNDLGFNKATVSTWCNGKKIPRLESMLRLAAYFNVSLSIMNGCSQVDDVSKKEEINPLSLQTALFFQRDDPKDVELLRAYNMLDDNDREMVRDFAVRLAKKE